jgi:hypothetical protein
MVGEPAAATNGREGTFGPVAAGLGGLVTFVTVFLPLSPVVGGAVAGYLRRGDARTGAAVGGVAGLVTLVLAAALAGSLLSLLPGAPGAAPIPAPFGVFLGVGGLAFAVYVLLLSAVGGVCGSFAASEIDILGR